MGGGCDRNDGIRIMSLLLIKEGFHSNLVEGFGQTGMRLKKIHRFKVFKGRGCDRKDRFILIKKGLIKMKYKVKYALVILG